MSAFEEFQAEVDRGMATLQDAYALVEQARRVAEDAAAQYRALADESSSHMLQSAADRADQVMAALDDASGLMMAGSSEFEAYLAEIGAKASGSGSGAGPAGGVVTPGAAAEGSPGPFQKELESTDDGDDSLSRGKRFGRALVRNTEDFAEQAKDWTTAGYSTSPPLDPGPTTTHTETAQQVSSTPPPQATPGQDVSSAFIVGVMMVEAFTRFARRRREKNG